MSVPKQQYKMASKLIIVLSAFTISCLAQRSPYAGRHPIGYPEITTTTKTTTPRTDELGNRFGDDDNQPTTTTQRLPIEALGDRDLIRRLSLLPVDKQPFWFINWKALEEFRKNPHTYTPKDNVFIDHASNNLRFV